MLEKIKSLFRKYKKKITPLILVMTALIFYVGYVHFQLSMTQARQDKIIYSIASNIENENVRDIKTHAIEIRAKIDNYKSCGNDSVDSSVLEFYEKSYALAKTGDKACYIFEMLAENMTEMYNLGVKDGNKMWGKRNASF